uniref:Ig-like domain-containing protein n=1 Tax=Sinocyclocheilus grahami TaxID=75366 RepID=A0A672KGL8_SINGR
LTVKEIVSVKEGDSVTLQTDVTTNQHEKIKWFFNDTRIAEINGITRYICTDVQCKDGDERFRDRLKLDHQTGSLTITNTRTTDSGDYHLEIINSGSDSEKTFSVTVHGESFHQLSVKEGDSVTLQTDVTTNQHEKIKWFFNDTRIAEINGITRYICTDVQCKDGDERFRDRLKLDNQTGSLTITNTRTTDSGVYHLEIINSGSDSEKTFSVTVHGESFHQCLKPSYMC